LLDRLKSKQAQNLSLDERFGVPTMSDSLQKKIEHKDELTWVGLLIDRLPEKERMIIQLREIEQYDFDQIASILNLPEGTVRVYLSRIRKKLRKQFIRNTKSWNLKRLKLYWRSILRVKLAWKKKLF